MRKKTFRLLLAVGLIALGLTGCSRQKEQKEQKTGLTEQADVEEKVVLKWAVWDTSLINYWELLADAYTEENPHVVIELEDLGSTDYQTVLTTDLSVNGKTYDLITIKDMPVYAILEAKGMLEPLKGYIERDGYSFSDDPKLEEQITVEDEIYQIPFRNDQWLIYYNKDLFDEAGVPYPDNDMTVEEYDKMVRLVSGERNGRKIYGAHYHTWRSTVQLFGILDGKHSILDGNYDFMKPYYEMVKAQEEDGICRTYVDTNVSQLHYAAAFAAGNTATMNMGSWYINTLITNLKSGEYKKELCGNWGIARYPHPEGAKAGTTLGSMTGLAISTASKEKEEAWNFIKFAGSGEGAEIIAATGALPANMSERVLEILTGLEGFPKDEESRMALQAEQIYLEAPYDKAISGINTILDEYHRDIMDGSVSIEEGIRKMNEETPQAKGGLLQLPSLRKRKNMV